MQAKQFININGNEPLPELDQKYNKWYEDVHVPIVLKHPAFLGATRYKLAAGVSDPNHPGLAEPKGGYPRYLTIYQLEGEEGFRAYQSSPEMKEAREDVAQTWKSGEFTIKFRAQYKARGAWEGKVKTQVGMIHMVGTMLPPEREDEFNQWYDEIHIPVLLRDPKLLGLTRYELASGVAFPDQSPTPGWEEGYPRYLTIYSFENPESFQAYDHSPEMQAENADFRKLWQPGVIVKVIMRAQYTPLKTWTK